MEKEILSANFVPIYLDNLSRKFYIRDMKAYTVGEFKAKFSELLALVRDGEEVEILFGKVKEPVAKLVPVKDKNRELGVLDGKARFTEKDGGKITEEEFLGLT